MIITKAALDNPLLTVYYFLSRLSKLDEIRIVAKAAALVYDPILTPDLPPVSLL